jgi:WhiB family redox-sensing transcriptional regulator
MKEVEHVTTVAPGTVQSGPIAPDEVVWTDAQCATGDARLLHLFFSEEQSEIDEAKAICRECPVRLPCLEGAIERREPWGVWGGKLFHRGAARERMPRRGRPPKGEPREEVA